MKSDEVESRLGELGLRASTSALDDRIARSLESEKLMVMSRPAWGATRRWGLGLAAAAGVVLIAAAVYVGSPTPPVDDDPVEATNGTRVLVGRVMPAFSMADSTGQSHSLSDYEGQIVVMSVGKTQCPWWPGALEGMDRLETKYAGRGVSFLGVESGTGSAPADIALFVGSQDIRYPILWDEANHYADRIHAKRTPAMYVVARDGTLAYSGAFDDREYPHAPASVNYVAEALEQLLAGDFVTVASSEPQGCPIGADTVPLDESAKGLGYIN